MDMFSYLLGKSSGGGKGALVPVVVDELPEIGEAGKLYLVPKEEVETDDEFDEYIYVNDDWELIGTAKIDISGKQDKLTAGDNITIDQNNVISSIDSVYYLEGTQKYDILGFKKGLYIINPSVGGLTQLGLYYSPKGGAENNPLWVEPLDGRILVLKDINANLDSKTNVITYFIYKNSSLASWSIYVDDNNSGLSQKQFSLKQGLVDTQGSQYVYGEKSFSNLKIAGEYPADYTFDNKSVVSRKYIDDKVYDYNSLADKGIVHFPANGVYTEQDGIVLFRNHLYKALVKTNATPLQSPNDWENVDSDYEDCKYATLGDISGSGSDDILFLQNNDTSAETMAKIGEAITSHYQKGLHISLTNNASYAVAEDRGLILYNRLNIKTSNYAFSCDCVLPYNSKTYMRIVVNGSWNNDVYTVSGLQYSNVSTSADSLTTTNTTAYTPTSQYHPATKGYVDSAIASAITDALGGDY